MTKVTLVFVSPPDDANKKSIDIRKFVKIKRLPGGGSDAGDSSIVDGEVFSGRVMRVGMKMDRAKPRVLLIRYTHDQTSFAYFFCTCSQGLLKIWTTDIKCIISTFLQICF